MAIAGKPKDGPPARSIQHFDEKWSLAFNGAAVFRYGINPALWRQGRNFSCSSLSRRLIRNSDNRSGDDQNSKTCHRRDVARSRPSRLRPQRNSASWQLLLLQDWGNFKTALLELIVRADGSDHLRIGRRSLQVFLRRNPWFFRPKALSNGSLRLETLGRVLLFKSLQHIGAEGCRFDVLLHKLLLRFAVE